MVNKYGGRVWVCGERDEDNGETIEEEDDKGEGEGEDGTSLSSSSPPSEWK